MKSKKVYEGKIPFSPFTDEPMYYAARDGGYNENGEHVYKDPIWKDNEIFDDKLEYRSYYRGRSAAGMEFKSVYSGKVYTVFMTDFDGMVKYMVNGVVGGKFAFCKCGGNYGLRMIEDA